jgi:hypothetical protein
MSAELKALAERVMALTGPCRETDALIWCALNTEGYNRPQMHFTTGDWFCVLDAKAGRPLDFQSPDSFTASLDAAMTLVPDGWLTREVWQDHDGAEWHWTIYPAFNYSRETVKWAQAGSAALALTAAALLARAAA